MTVRGGVTFEHSDLEGILSDLSYPVLTCCWVRDVASGVVGTWYEGGVLGVARGSPGGT